MDNVSEFGGPVREPVPGSLPEIRPFDAADGDEVDDDDTVVADDDDFDPEPDPVAAAAATVFAPRGPLPVVPGYTVSAVVTSLDADEPDDYPQIAILGRKTDSLEHAKGVAHAAALSPAQLASYRLPFQPDEILVSDHTGRTVKRVAVRKAA